MKKEIFLEVRGITFICKSSFYSNFKSDSGMSGFSSFIIISFFSLNHVSIGFSPLFFIALCGSLSLSNH